MRNLTFQKCLGKIKSLSFRKLDFAGSKSHPFPVCFIVRLKKISTKALLAALQIYEARTISRRCLMRVMTPVYFPQFAQTTRESGIILFSSAVQMGTALSIMHHLHSPGCHAERARSRPPAPHLCSFKGGRGCIQTAGYTLS